MDERFLPQRRSSHASAHRRRQGSFQSEDARLYFRQWAERSPNVTLLEVPGAGHPVLGPIADHPQSFVSVLVEMNRLIERGIIKFRGGGI